MTKKKLTAAKLVFFFLLTGAFISAKAQNNFFTDAAEPSFKLVNQQRQIIPQKFRTVRLDTASVLSFAGLVPTEAKLINRELAPVIEIPMPNGKSAKFHIWETPIMEPALAKQFPNIKTFTGQGIDDKSATIKIDWNDFGFHAMILSPVTGSIFIDPYDAVTKTNYISYYAKDYKKTSVFKEYGPLPSKKQLTKGARIEGMQAISCIGTQLRTYRLAVACTHEYAIAATGLATPTKAQTLSKITTTVNRVNGVYEKEVAIRMTLVATENNIIFVTAATDPFTGNNDPSTLINESQTVINSTIGTANYDIGHTFSTGGGGLAQLHCVCVSSMKAQGITGTSQPYGDAYDIDYVAHEMGHQFGANHPFNAETGACGGNANIGTNAEPGSGSTIMAYAGICDANDLQLHSDPQFHAISFEEIVTNYISGGATCGVITATGNSAPVVNAGADYTIPKSTSFVLTGSATDPNSDPLTYSWEEVDVNGPTGDWDNPSGNAPLFRSFAPVSTGVRHFPKLSSQSSNTTVIGEILPDYARTMHFRLTARDNKAGGGGVCSDENVITVDGNAGPFVVTSPNTAVTWYVNDFQTVTWDVAKTNASPINCTNVTIELSTDGGLTFPVTILASTPNDGTQEIQVPNNVSATARIRVRAVGNIFYDISNVNFNIQVAPTATFVFNNPDAKALCGSASGSITLASGSLKSFTTAIALSASLNPPGTTVSFGTSSLTPGNSTTVTLNNAGSLAPGAYTIRVTGVAGSVTKTRDIVFIAGSSALAPTLVSPAVDAVGVATPVNFSWNAVAGAISYTLELSKTVDFSVIDKTISGITTASTSTNVDENTIYFWRVKTVNACGTGAPSSANRFKTGISSCKISTDVPKVIPEIASTVTSTLTIPAAAGAVINNLKVVQLTGAHAYLSDLIITLKGPDGTSVELLSGVCDAVGSSFSLNVYDQAPPAALNCDSLALGTLHIRPSTPLAAFNGKNSTGTWTLTVEDLYDLDGGQISSWGLNINTASADCVFTTTPMVTSYTFTGNGNWNNAANWSNNTVPPSPLPSGATITINHSAGGQCILNVPQTISSGAAIVVNAGKNLVVQGALTIQ